MISPHIGEIPKHLFWIITRFNERHLSGYCLCLTLALKNHHSNCVEGSVFTPTVACNIGCVVLQIAVLVHILKLAKQMVPLPSMYDIYIYLPTFTIFQPKKSGYIFPNYGNYTNPFSKHPLEFLRSESYPEVLGYGNGKDHCDLHQQENTLLRTLYLLESLTATPACLLLEGRKVGWKLGRICIPESTNGCPAKRDYFNRKYIFNTKVDWLWKLWRFVDCHDGSMGSGNIYSTHIFVGDFWW